MMPLQCHQPLTAHLRLVPSLNEWRSTTTPLIHHYDVLLKWGGGGSFINSEIVNYRSGLRVYHFIMQNVIMLSIKRPVQCAVRLLVPLNEIRTCH